MNVKQLPESENSKFVHCYFLFEEKVTKENISKSKRTIQSLPHTLQARPVKQKRDGLVPLRLNLSHRTILSISKPIAQKMKINLDEIADLRWVFHPHMVYDSGGCVRRIR